MSVTLVHLTLSSFSSFDFFLSAFCKCVEGSVGNCVGLRFLGCRGGRGGTCSFSNDFWVLYVCVILVFCFCFLVPFYFLKKRNSCFK